MAKIGVELNQFLKSLNKIVPLYLAENWDNVGVLIRPSKIKNIVNLLLTNDLTESVLEEAINKQCNFIFSYHPPIFVPLKSLNHLSSWKEKIAVKCIENSIVVYSPHTALDSINNGINDWIVSQFNFKTKSPLKCKSSEDGRTILDNVGVGRQIELCECLSIQEIVDISKKHFNLSHLRLALASSHNLDSKVSKIAVVAGSGYSVLKNALADLFITGEMSHHEVLDLNQNGITVILTEHSNCERGYLKCFVDLLKMEIGDDKLNLIISDKDKDPLTVI